MVETLLAHRDGPGGLFIGASKLSFALMNSAPAELLHPLSYAALQPLLTQLPDDIVVWPPSIKTPAIKPASEFCFRKTKSFFKENAALPDLIRRSGVDKCNRFGLLLFINVVYRLFSFAVFDFYRPF